MLLKETTASAMFLFSASSGHPKNFPFVLWASTARHLPFGLQSVFADESMSYEHFDLHNNVYVTLGP